MIALMLNLYSHTHSPTLHRPPANQIIYLLMWNYQTPFLPPYLPFYQPYWPFQHPPYPQPQPSLHSLPQISWGQEPSIQNQNDILKSQEQSDDIAPRNSQVKTPKRTLKHRSIRRKRRQDSFDKKRQKKDRNLPSNISRYFISFLYQSSSALKAMGIQNQSSEQVLKSCISQAREHIRDNQNYVRPGILEKMFRGELLGRQQSSMFRVLFNRFVKVELKLVVSMMRKLRKKEKLTYFKLANKFLKKFMSRH